MMSAKFDEKKIQEQFKLYQLRREERVKAEAAERLAAEKRKAALNAKLASVQKACAPHPVTTAKAHKCGCGATIPKGSRVMVEAEITGYGYPEGYHFRSLYYCQNCRKVEEA